MQTFQKCNRVIMQLTVADELFYQKKKKKEGMGILVTSYPEKQVRMQGVLLLDSGTVEMRVSFTISWTMDCTPTVFSAELLPYFFLDIVFKDIIFIIFVALFKEHCVLRHKLNERLYQA